jgi:hypothetical protein
MGDRSWEIELHAWRVTERGQHYQPPPACQSVSEKRPLLASGTNQYLLPQIVERAIANGRATALSLGRADLPKAK